MVEPEKKRPSAIVIFGGGFLLLCVGFIVYGLIAGPPSAPTAQAPPPESVAPTPAPKPAQAMPSPDEAKCGEAERTCAEFEKSVGIKAGFSAADCPEYLRGNCKPESLAMMACLGRIGDCTFEANCLPAKNALDACLGGKAPLAAPAAPKLFGDWLATCDAVRGGKTLESLCSGGYRVNGFGQPQCGESLDNGRLETMVHGGSARAWCAGNFFLDDKQDLHNLWLSIVAYAKADLWATSGSSLGSTSERVYFTRVGWDGFCEESAGRYKVFCKLSIR